MRIDVRRTVDEVVLTPVGRLEVATAPQLIRTLGKHLAGGAPVLVDLAGLALHHIPSVAAFPAARRSAGAAPASLVLFAARADMSSALRSCRTGIPVAADLASARAALRRRPGARHATYCLPDLSRTGDIVRSVCARWRLPALHGEVAVAMAEEMVAASGEEGCDITLEHDGQHLGVRVRDHRVGGGTSPRERVAQVSLVSGSR